MTLRRVLILLYCSIAVPWVAWFGYQIFDVPYGPVWRYVSLMLVPIGGLILILATVWLMAGIRKSRRAANEPNRAAVSDLSPSESVSKQQLNREISASTGVIPASPEADAIIKKLDRLTDDEKSQLDDLPEAVRSKVLSGAECDEIIGAAGEFGRDHRNPIPVNGPLGEMIYLSNLRTATSQPLMFHRLGSVRDVDAFETVSFDGSGWDVLFLDLYHPRKSRRAPAGYRIAVGAERERLLLGTDEFVASFPDQLLNAISNSNARLLGARLRPHQVREAIERINFKRSADHQLRLNTVMALLEANAAAEPLTEAEAESARKAAPKVISEFEEDSASEAATTSELLTTPQANSGPKPVTELETLSKAEDAPVLAQVAAKASPKLLTEFCNQISEHHLQHEVERMDKGDLSELGRILFLLIAMAASNFWKQTLKLDDLESSFAKTNPDVVIAEALYWILCFFGKMMITNFNPVLVVAQTDEHEARVPNNEIDNLFALRKARELMNAQIEATTGWDVEDVEAPRLKEYCDIKNTEQLIRAFTRRMLLALGKQAIQDKDLDNVGRLVAEDTKVGIAVAIWFTTMPLEYHRTFKNACTLYYAP
jgi:hypothetical protein